MARRSGFSVGIDVVFENKSATTRCCVSRSISIQIRTICYTGSLAPTRRIP